MCDRGLLATFFFESGNVTEQGEGLESRIRNRGKIGEAVLLYMR
jgi:hypothetical protein